MKHFAITTLILLSGLMVLSSPKKNENSTAKELVHQIEKSIEGDHVIYKDRKRFKFNDVKSFKTTVKVAGEEIFKNYMPTPLPKKYRKPISIDLRSGYY